MKTKIRLTTFTTAPSFFHFLFAHFYILSFCCSQTIRRKSSFIDVSKISPYAKTLKSVITNSLAKTCLSFHYETQVTHPYRLQERFKLVNKRPLRKPSNIPIVCKTSKLRHHTFITKIKYIVLDVCKKSRSSPPYVQHEK